MRFPLKKIRKQFKLLLLLVLLTFAIGFTYLHVIQGRAIKLHSSYGKDMEKQTEGLGSGQKKLPHSSSSHEPEDSSNSADETKHGDELSESELERYGKPDIQKLLSQKLLKLPWKPEVFRFPGSGHLGRATTTHTHTRSYGQIWNHQSTYHTCFWTVGRNRSTRRKPTHARGEHANSAQKDPMSSPGFELGTFLL